MPIITYLLPWIDLIAGLSIACAKIAIIEDQRCQARRTENFRIAVEIHLLDRGKPMRHYDRGCCPRRVFGLAQPSPKDDPFSIKFDIAPHNVRIISKSQVARYAQP